MQHSAIWSVASQACGTPSKSWRISAAVLAGPRSRTRARHALQRLAGCFAPGDFYVELVNQLEPGSPQLLRGLLSVAAEAGLPVVATNNVHYLEQAGHRLHYVLASRICRARTHGR